MPDRPTIDIAVVGLGFGEAFLPIYRAHPNVGDLAIVDTSADRLREVGDRYGIEERFDDLDAVLDDPRWDAVHILAPVAFHAGYTLAALRAGKHVACAVPMATGLDDLSAIVAAQAASGRVYMMMETSVYGREYRYAAMLHRDGRLGGLTHYRGFHIQNLDGFPRYWLGYPPMRYVTHALSPILALTATTVEDVVAYGTGRLRDDRRGDFDNPFPMEVGLFRLRGRDLVAQVEMSFFQTARPYIEGFDLHGDAMSIEWPVEEGEPLRTYTLLPPGSDGGRGRRAAMEPVDPPDDVAALPPSLVGFVRTYEVTPVDGGPPIRHVAGHGGSHPFLVHEFVSSIVEGRPPAIDAPIAAAWTAPGIVAHESALRGGARLAVPTF